MYYDANYAPVGRKKQTTVGLCLCYHGGAPEGAEGSTKTCGILVLIRSRFFPLSQFHVLVYHEASEPSQRLCHSHLGEPAKEDKWSVTELKVLFKLFKFCR